MKLYSQEYTWNILQGKELGCYVRIIDLCAQAKHNVVYVCLWSVCLSVSLPVCFYLKITY